ncbi:hypothetical protein D9756_011323 [Leucocoprinus leucothites]|uniref:Uncharacterized protein n=1 Tax=Leucocoprinus leucothites TaxID=201217 RepID=A0A8H5CMJ3_9AGAR|nr:hypothetical protein D9756_011323 [Leucoagaricus leucothites]
MDTYPANHAPFFYPRSSHNKHPRVVVVRANETGLSNSDTTTSHPQSSALWSKHDGDWIKSRGLMAITESRSMLFEFNGTGIAVVTFDEYKNPPIPDAYHAQWECFLDDEPFRHNVTNHHSHHNPQPDIPGDGKNKVCQIGSLENRNHTLRVNVKVNQIPALFHSIRYVPLLPPSCGSDGLNDATVRIDPQDNCFFHSDPSFNWDWGDKPRVKSSKLPSYLTVSFYGQQLQWIGDTDDDLKTEDVKFVLDGRQPHNLSISTEKGTLKLDHLLVTTGKPTPIPLRQFDANPTPSTRTLPRATIAGAITGSIVGLALLVLAFFLICRSIRRRRRPEDWKDSALPSLIEHPGSRTSSRSSFSRGFVTGDIEYNPEAQKKMDALDAQPVITRPPSAVILHADSGLRIRFPVSDIPPQYTQI